jgi:hypothetical protein
MLQQRTLLQLKYQIKNPSWHQTGRYESNLRKLFGMGNDKARLHKKL